MPGTFAICAIFKNEARYLAEWVEFHRLVGCSKFLLYDNESTDDWRDVLAPYITAGLVTVTPWSRSPHQITAYSDALDRGQRLSNISWCAFIDLDEFIVPNAADTVPEVLRKFPGVGAVAAHWRTFGSSGHVKRPDGLVIESYLQRTPDSAAVNRHYKCIVNTALLRSGRPLNGHAFHLVGAETINTTGTRYSMPGWLAVPGSECLPSRVLGWLHVWGSNGAIDKVGKTAHAAPTTAPLVIHHYFCKSAEDWQARVGRGDVNSGAYAGSRDRLRNAYDRKSTIEDKAAARYGAEVRRRLTHSETPLKSLQDVNRG